MKNLIILLGIVFSMFLIVGCEKSEVIQPKNEIITPVIPEASLEALYEYELKAYDYNGIATPRTFMVILSDSTMANDTILFEDSFLNPSRSIMRWRSTTNPVSMNMQVIVTDMKNEPLFINASFFVDNECIANSTGLLVGNGKPWDVFSMSYKF
jgi:hypothetical protein